MVCGIKELECILHVNYDKQNFELPTPAHCHPAALIMCSRTRNCIMRGSVLVVQKLFYVLFLIATFYIWQNADLWSQLSLGTVVTWESAEAEKLAAIVSQMAFA